jgi:hypothetical protein
MSKSLIIVESPAKARTLKKYLGKDYDVTKLMRFFWLQILTVRVKPLPGTLPIS